MNFPKKILTLLVFAFLLSSKCYKEKDIDHRLKVINSTPYGIYTIPSYNYPDTSLSFLFEERINANKSTIYIKQGTELRITNISLCYSDEWERLISNDTLLLFIFDEETVKSYGWERIKNEYLVYQRKSLTFSEIMNSNCTIVIQ